MLEFRTRLRRLLRQPIYIVSVLVSLGLGSAVSVAAFSFVNRRGEQFHAKIFVSRESLRLIEERAGRRFQGTSRP